MVQQSKQAEEMSEHVRNTVKNLKESADIVQTMDPAAVGMALGMTVLSGFIAPAIAKSKKQAQQVQEVETVKAG